MIRHSSKTKRWLTLFIFVVSVISLSFCNASFVYACVGARPISMGGAFVGVADDANATYWNPAGLTQLEDPEFTYTPTIHNRDEVNYDDFISLAFPLYLKEKDLDLGSLGISFVNSGYKTVAYRTAEKWYWFSYGKKFPLGLSLGFNLRNQYYKDRINEGWAVLYGNTWVYGPTEDTDETMAVDLSLFWKWKGLSLGLLWQDINEPEVTLFGVKSKYIRNLRPGFAFRPDDKTILSLELYDVTGESKGSDQNLRVGLERYFNLPWENTSIALRAGGYDINADDKANRAVTGGLGYKWKFSGLARNDRELPLDLSIDYAVMYWMDAPNGTDELTHMATLKISLPWEASHEKTATKSVTKERAATTMPVHYEITDKERYFRTVKNTIQQNLRPYKGLKEGATVRLVFTLSTDGQLKNIYADTKNTSLEKIIIDSLESANFPSAPQELQEKKEIKFNLLIDFLPSL